MVTNKTYLLPALVVLTTEFFIGLFVQDRFIRPFIGDLLVVILLYCAARIFVRWKVITTALVALLFAYSIEISQYFHLIYHLGWQNSLPARLVLGTSFSLTDMAMYSLGFMAIITIEYIRSGKHAFKL
jgi:hypothetical protein